MPATYLRIEHIIGDKKRGVDGLLAVSRSTWYAWVRKGFAPQPVRVGGHQRVCWREKEIHDFIRRAGSLVVPKAEPAPASPEFRFCPHCGHKLT